MAGPVHSIFLSLLILASSVQAEQTCQGEDCPATVNSLLQSGRKTVQAHTGNDIEHLELQPSCGPFQCPQTMCHTPQCRNCPQCPQPTPTPTPRATASRCDDIGNPSPCTCENYADGRTDGAHAGQDCVYAHHTGKGAKCYPKNYVERNADQFDPPNWTSCPNALLQINGGSTDTLARAEAEEVQADLIKSVTLQQGCGGRAGDCQEFDCTWQCTQLAECNFARCEGGQFPGATPEFVFPFNPKCRMEWNHPTCRIFKQASRCDDIENPSPCNCWGKTDGRTSGEHASEPCVYATHNGKGAKCYPKNYVETTDSGEFPGGWEACYQIHYQANGLPGQCYLDGHSQNGYSRIGTVLNARYKQPTPFQASKSECQSYCNANDLTKLSGGKHCYAYEVYNYNNEGWTCALWKDKPNNDVDYMWGGTPDTWRCHVKKA